MALFDSLNKIIKVWAFFIDGENVISLSVQCKFDLVSALENPFDFVFGGCETLRSTQIPYLRPYQVPLFSVYQ